jgi:hypothetical protein
MGALARPASLAMHSAAIVTAKGSWSTHLHERLHPGAHVVLLTSDELQAVEARRARFELRDTLLLLWPQMTSFAFLLRTPMAVSTTEQVIATGSAALHVDACRVAADLSEFFSATGKPRSGMGHAKAYGMGDGYGGDRANPPHENGRWPCNVALIHGPACRRVGEAKIDGHKGYPNGPGGSSSQFSQKGTPTTRKGAWAGHADANGKETVALWDCQPNCPASLLDRLSGDLPAGVAVRHRSGGKTFGGDVLKPAMADMSYGDRGGAARFYPQFASPWDLLDWLRALIKTPDGTLLEEV